MPSRGEILASLEQVAFPGFRHSVVRYGIVQDVSMTETGEVTVALLPATTRREVVDELRDRVVAALTTVPGVRSAKVVTADGGRGEPAAAKEGEAPMAIPGVRYVVAVSSAKGGVGKSTVAVNLALALHARGARVGLMDADVYGPSIPLMMGTEAKPFASGKKVAPVERYGIDLMSMGFFLDDKSPVIWRGPMVMGLIRQFLQDVEWGEQDYLVVDMPPGTGDAALTLAQQVAISGAVIVTTPQEVALQDVERGISMFRQVHVPILGIVENMASYTCPECGEHEDIFGSGGAESLGRQFGVTVLARLPIAPAIREGGDLGRPVAVTDANPAIRSAFAALAETVDRALASAGAAGQ